LVRKRKEKGRSGKNGQRGETGESGGGRMVLREKIKFDKQGRKLKGVYKN